MPTDADTSHGQAYGDWSAPKHDGALLVWPEAGTLGGAAARNAQLVDQAGELQFAGLTLRELRDLARRFVGHDSGPLILTGHQSELHHPGVWVKNAVIDAVPGNALHVAVDTDQPKHLALRWPGVALPVTDDPRLRSAAWAGLLDPPSPAHLNAADAADPPPLVVEWIADCRRYLIDQRDSPSPMTLAGMLADAGHRLDWRLGLRHSVVMLSGLLECEAWAAVVLEIARDAEGFAGDYNAALREHRAANGLEGTDRPMPDLAPGELPFWLDDLTTGRRARAMIGDVPDAADPADLLRQLRRRGLRLAPRALTLTLFLRLFLADLFVHGIGGGHYDRVLDRLLRRRWGIEPPTFAVATATLFHPDALGRERVCPSCLRREGHALRHDALGEEKAAWLEKIEAQPTFRARRAVFEAMHARRRDRLAGDPRYAAFLRRRAEAGRRLAEEAVLFDRELFYPVQTERRLTDLIARVRSASS